MQYTSAILVASFAITNVFAHGVVTSIEGANKVSMPGLSTIEGTPRDCPTPGCGSEADTAIIRSREIGTNKASALGRTQGGGPIDASKMISMFMGAGGGNATATKQAREIHAANLLRRSLVPRAANGGTKTPKGTVETGVKAAAGMGAEAGMPTCSDDGKVSMTYHQINQDGAGPLKAMLDTTSGGTDPKAFKQADVTTNVPGIGIGGLSAAAVMDFPLEVQMPAGTTCSGSVGGASDVCVVMVMNSAAAGPFGGSAAFTQSPAAKKRAIEYNLSKRRFARALVKKTQEESAAAAIAELEKLGSATTAESPEKREATANGLQGNGNASPATIEDEEDEEEEEETKRDVSAKPEDAEAAAAIAELEKLGSATTAESLEKREATANGLQENGNASPATVEDEEDEEEEEEETKRDVSAKPEDAEAAAAIAELEKLGSATTAESLEKREATTNGLQGNGNASPATIEDEEDEEEEEEEETKRDVSAKPEAAEAAAAIAELEKLGSATTAEDGN